MTPIAPSNGFIGKTSPKVALAAFGAVACGFALGTMFGSSKAQTEAVERANERLDALLKRLESSALPPPGRVVASAIDIPKLRAEVRAILIQELRSHEGRDADAAPAKTPEEAAASHDEVARAAAYERGQGLIRSALASGTWDQKQATELRSLSANLGYTQHKALIDELFTNINAGKIKASGVPF